MYYLCLLGGVSLAGPSGTVSARALQQRRLALLALLAVAGEKGCSRDRLIGYVWPEIEQDRARHRLADALYQLRKSLDHDVVLGEGDVLRLNLDVVGCDVGAFLDALDSNELQTATSLYGGLFMDGFYLSGVPEFAHWMDSQRRRFADAYADAVERLAEQAEADEDYPGAVNHWKRLSACDPYNSRYALRLMQAMVRLGDPANAIQHAEEHERLLREELEIEPDEGIRAFVEQLKLEPVRAGQVVEAGSDREVRGTVLPAARRPHLARAGKRSEWGRRRWTLAGAALLLAAAGYFALSRDSIEPLPEDRVIVFPFENLTGNPNLDDLGIAAAHRIATGLSRADELRVIPADQVIQTLRSLSSDATNREVAASLRAGILVTGVITSKADELHFEAAIARVATGEALPAVEASGPADPKEAMRGVDALRDVLMGALAVSVDERSAYFAHRPPSYSAYQAFFRAMQCFFDHEWEASAQNYLEAYRQDTTFLMALLGATMASMNLGEWPMADSLLSVVEPRVGELSPKERYWFEWLTALARGDLEGALRATRLELARDPGDVFTRNLLVEDAVAVGGMKEAMDALDQLDPDDPVVRNIRPFPARMAWANHVLGRYQEGLQFAHAGIERWPHDVWLRTQEVIALIALGRLDSIDSLLVSIEKMEPRGGGSVGSVLRRVSAELARHGYPEEAVRMADRAIHWYSSRDSDSYLLALGESYLLAQRAQEALELIRRSVAENPDNLRAHGVLGLALAETGDQEGAKAESRWIEALDRPYLLGRDTYWRAAIAAHLGRNEEAVELLRRAHREGRRLAGLHADPHFAPLWGFEPFERFIEPRA